MSCIIFNFNLLSAEKDSGTNNNANYFLIGQQFYHEVSINVHIHLILV